MQDMRKRKTYLFLYPILIIALIIMSFAMKHMIQKAPSWNSLTIEEATIGFTPEVLLAEGTDQTLNKLIMYEQINSYDELEQKSDVILSVKLVDRKQKSDMMLSEVIVQRIFKEDSSIKEGDHIFIYEPFAKERDVFRLYSINLPLREKEEYIVFLKEFYKSELTYNYVSSLYGKYAVSGNQEYVVENFDLSMHLKMDEIKNYDQIGIESFSEQYKELDTAYEMHLLGLKDIRLKQDMLYHSMLKEFE